MTAWRPMQPADLPAVAAIEAACHPPLPPEGEAIFAERLALFPAGCLVLGDPVAGYAVAHPWVLSTPPPLGQTLGALPPAPDCLFVHDLALLPGARGLALVQGALVLLDQAAKAQGLARLGLVAVHGTGPYWARHGFVPVPGAPAGYVMGAVSMQRACDAIWPRVSPDPTAPNGDVPGAGHGPVC
jgi:hypothetical protein